MLPSADLSRFLKGTGLDASVDPAPVRSLIPGIRHHVQEPNQLYSLQGRVEPDSLDFITSFYCLLDTKYYPLQMRQWLGALKAGGHLVIRFEEYDNLKVAQFKLDYALFFRHSLELSYRHKQGKTYTYVFRKVFANPDKPDGMARWTFGIITLGSRNEWVEQMIRSIVAQKIPHFEIIVCGKYFEREEPFIRYVEMPNDEIPNLTRKKNRIVQEARFENVVVLHDRIVLEDGWYEGMKRFGNDWDFLGCKVTHRGSRSYDWFTTGYPTYLMEFDQKRAALEYADWDRWAVINAGIFILKKRAFKEAQWNEKDYYPGNDDMIFCTDLENKGFLPRFNPYSSCRALSFHALDLLTHRKDAKRLGPITGPFVELWYWRIMRWWYGLFVRFPALRKLRENALWKSVGRAFKSLRLKLLNKEVNDQSWSKVNKQDII